MLKCWSWISRKCISLAQVSEGYLCLPSAWGTRWLKRGEVRRGPKKCSHLFGLSPVLDFPRRPPWSYEMSKEQLMSQEERSFQEYLGKIHGAYTSEKLSYFEHNLEVMAAC